MVRFHRFFPAGRHLWHSDTSCAVTGWARILSSQKKGWIPIDKSGKGGRVTGNASGSLLNRPWASSRKTRKDALLRMALAPRSSSERRRRFPQRAEFCFRGCDVPLPRPPYQLAPARAGQSSAAKTSALQTSAAIAAARRKAPCFDWKSSRTSETRPASTASAAAYMARVCQWNGIARADGSDDSLTWDATASQLAQ